MGAQQENPELEDREQPGTELPIVLELADQLPARHHRALDPNRTFTKIIEQARQRRQAAGTEEVKGD